MDAPFAIRFDARTSVLHLTLSGFWTPDTLRDFARALLAEVARIQKTRPSFDVLSDSRAFPVQSPEVGQGFTRLMSGSSERNTGRRAIVVASALNKMQAERTLASPNLRVFLDPDEAAAWLATPRDAA